MEKKICKNCNSEKNIKEFYKRKDSKDGYRNECKSCKNIQNDLYKKNNSDKISKYKKIYDIKNKCKLKEYRKTYRIENIDKLKEYGKIYYGKNKNTKIFEYKKKNKSKIKIYRNKYRINNKDKINEYLKIKRHEDCLFKYKNNIRSLVYNSFKRNGFKKQSKTFDIIGCSYEFLLEYIKNQFEAWMTWNNHGTYTGNYNETWQVDHIIPISNGLSEEEVIKLNHYTNLRPLCSKKNLEKSNNLTES